MKQSKVKPIKSDKKTAKVKYYAKENSSIGTHSFYAVPIPNGTLTFDELLWTAR